MPGVFRVISQWLDTVRTSVAQRVILPRAYELRTGVVAEATQFARGRPSLPANILPIHFVLAAKFACTGSPEHRVEKHIRLGAVSAKQLPLPISKEERPFNASKRYSSC